MGPIDCLECDLCVFDVKGFCPSGTKTGVVCWDGGSTVVCLYSLEVPHPMCLAAGWRFSLLVILIFHTVAPKVVFTLWRFACISAFEWQS